MRINPIVYAVLVLAVFLGVIYASQSAGLWSSSGKQDSQGRAVQPDSADVSTIKGWMTLEQISASYNVTLEEIIQAFNLPADTPATTAVKDLESETFSVSGLRDWLASRSSSQSVQPTATPLPTVAPTPTPTPQAAAQPEEHSEEEFKVSGQTTFQDLLDWGLTQETIETVIGIAMPDPSLRLRDYLNGTGVRFSEVKDKLQAELDKLK